MSSHEAVESDLYKRIDPAQAFPLARSGTFSSLELGSWPAQWLPSDEFPTPQSVGNDDFSQFANGAYSFSSEPIHYRLGEAHLPVAPYREHFLETVAKHQNVVVSSETGSGKSSQLGLWLLEAGAPRVFITQPRIVAARDLLARARHNLGPEHEHLAGYLTGNADDSDCGPNARLIYATEDLLFKMANRGELKPNEVVIPDEAHERTPGMIFMLWRLKQLQDEIPGLKIVISSATIDTEKFANYIGNPVLGGPAPVMILPGRTFPVEWDETDLSVAEVMRQEIGDGRNVLAFEPGVPRMQRTMAKGKPNKANATVHALYGDQTPKQQKESLIPDDTHHIVATRVGETSLTPQGKDTVVDSGLSNVGRYHSGVWGVETVWSSKDTIKQRGGRVGRTKPGRHILAQPDDAPKAMAYEDRADYESPPIQNTSVTSYIIELLRAGVTLKEDELFESPTAENLAHDYRILHRLGAIAAESSGAELTLVGKEMTDMPLVVSLARMVIEARSKPLDETGVSRDDLVLQVAAAGVVQQVKGILDTSQFSGRRYLLHRSAKDQLSTEQMSDLLFELDVFSTVFQKHDAAIAKGTDEALASFEHFLISRDIIPNRYYKARRTFEELCRRLDLDPHDLQKPEGQERRLIIECQVAGTEEIFVRRGKNLYRDIRDERRQTGSKSIIAKPLAQLIMGVPFDISSLQSNGRHNRRLIVAGSAVSLELIQEFAPHRLSMVSAGHAISRKGHLVERKSYFFDDELKIAEVEEPPSPTLATRRALIAAMMLGKGDSAVTPGNPTDYVPGTPNAADAIKQWGKVQSLEHRSPNNLNTAGRYESLIRKVVRKSLDVLPLDVVDPAQLDEVIPRVYLSAMVRPTRRRDIPEIIRTSPDAVAIAVDEDRKEYLPVNYRNNIAYISLTNEQACRISPADLADLKAHHDIKLRIGSGKYQHFEAAWDSIENVKKTRAEKHERRESKREALTVAAATGHDLTEVRETSISREIVNNVRTEAANKNYSGRERRRTQRVLIRHHTSDE